MLTNILLADRSGTLTIPVSGTVARTLSAESSGVGRWGRVTSVSVALVGLSHTYPGDLDFLLVGPNGTNLEFWSDAGAGFAIFDRTFVIADSAGSSLPQFSAIPSSIMFRPTDYTDATGVETAAYWTALPAIAINHPGPTGGATFAGAFAGAWVDRSTWQLWVTDDVPYDGGSLAYWQVNIGYQRIAKPNDFDGNNVSNFLWQNSDGTPAIWSVYGLTPVSGGTAANPGPDWHVKGAGDFDDDGNADILWQNLDGTPAIWRMDGLNVLAASPVGMNPGSAWHIKRTGDFNFDGKADILWQHDDGTPGIWLMDGIDRAGRGSGRQPTPGRLAGQGRRRFQRRRQVRHPVAERRRHAGHLADERHERARPGPVGTDPGAAGTSRAPATSTTTAMPTSCGRTPTARRASG